MNNYEYKKLCPFKWFVLENFPFIEADFDALTNWQLFCKLGKEINKIINSTNSLGTQVVNLTDYVSNYFDNLDVQDEINNKLDQMAQSGELEEIIAQYLNTQAVLGFNTVANMKSATNLTNTSIVKTLGYNSYNDGLGSFYKIRNILNTDVVDNINIIPINANPNLVAEKIIPNIENKVDIIENKVNILDNSGRKFILISDSYGTLTNDNTTTWCEEFIKNSGINRNNFIIKAQGGARFDISQTAKTFSQLLNEVENSNEITDIIVCGGYNDQGVPYETIKNSIEDFKNIANNKFPNAKISIGFIGCTTDYEKLYNVAYGCRQYIRTCKALNINYLNNVQFTLKESGLMSADLIHPNDAGQEKLGYNILYAYLKGSISEYIEYEGINLVANEIFSIGGNQAWYFTRENGVTFIGSKTQLNFNAENYNMGSSNNLIELCKINENSPIIGDSYDTNVIPVHYLIQNAGTFDTGMGVLLIKNRSVKFRPLKTTSNNYKEFNSITWIQLQPFKHALDTMLL